MKRRRPPTQSLSNLRAKARRDEAANLKHKKRRSEIRASWAAGILSVLLGAGSVRYFLAATGPPFEGRGAALADALYGMFGPIGPALLWLGLSVILAIVCIAAALGWGKEVD